MAPLEHDLMPETAEIALARSAAPSSISRAAQVMLQREGYATAVKGESGFVCIVGRAWGKATLNSEFLETENARSPPLQSTGNQDAGAALPRVPS